jgi:glycosyltransferase involved in cell wall biosynthesis
VVQEALACGVPVVAVNVGDTKERLARSRRSRLAHDDPEALGAALCEVLVQRIGETPEIPPPDLDGDLEVVSAGRIAGELRRIYGEAAHRS